MKRSECCNPSAKSDKDRCYDCPMRDKPFKPGQPSSQPTQPQPPAAARPSTPPKKQSQWMFLHGDTLVD